VTITPDQIMVFGLGAGCGVLVATAFIATLWLRTIRRQEQHERQLAQVYAEHRRNLAKTVQQTLQERSEAQLALYAERGRPNIVVPPEGRTLQ
jgi:hypothetical protein